VGIVTKRDIRLHLHLHHHHWASVVARTWVVVVGILRRVVDTVEVRRIRLVEEGNIHHPVLVEGPEGVDTIVEDIEVLRRRNLYST
jgi:hypothetical protein